MGKFGSKLLIYLKSIFLKKLTTITYVYLVSPIILQHFKQILRWHTTQNFCLEFIDELEIQLFIKTTVEVGLAYKKCKNYPSLPLPNNPENQNFEKMKKASGEVIILHVYQKSH